MTAKLNKTIHLFDNYSNEKRSFDFIGSVFICLLSGRTDASEFEPLVSKVIEITY